MDPVSSASRATRWRSVFAGALGNFVEFYDWGIYAFMAPIFARQIFSSSDPFVSLLMAFSTFALGYLVRPVGALVFGVYSDRLGRRRILAITILLMAAGSLVIACAPTYAQAGLVGPALVIFARVVQGFAAGGEGGSAQAYLSELGTSRRRALISSLQQVSIGVSSLFAMAVSALVSGLLSPEQLNAFGWRLPFLLGAIMGLVGLYLRRQAAETHATPAGTRPVFVELTREWRSLAMVVGLALFPTTAYLTWQIYLPTYIKLTTTLSHSQALTISVIGSVCSLAAIPVFATMSDRLGRRPMLIGFALAALAWGAPTYLGIPRLSDQPLSILGIVIVGNLILASMAGSIVASMTEMFGRDARATGVGFGYALSVVISGASFTPIVTGLLEGRRFGWIFAYFAAMGVVSLATYLAMPETRGRELG